MALGKETAVEERGDWIENVVRIYRCATVMKGGRRFSFSALVVVGDGKGRVGIGYGKANEVPSAVEKGMKDARKHLMRVAVINGTIPHQVTGKYGASIVILLPAAAGTGIKAGGGVRAVLEGAGIHNILSKSHRTNNPKNAVKATMNGLLQLRTREDVARLRGVSLK